MNPKMAGYLILQGGFLVLLGVLGFLSNPEKANTPLLAFGAFGAVAAGLGVLGARGVRGSLPLAVADALAAGRPFTLQVAGERLRIPAGARFNLEHEREGKTKDLEIPLQWKRR
jgi:hypothetical protein